MTQTPAKPAVSKRKQQARRETRTLVILGSVVLLIMALAVILTRSQEQAGSPSVVQDTALLVRDDSITLGPADAAVTLVEFLDFECEACRAAHPTVKRILNEYDGRIRYVVRYFSNHNNSVLAVAAAEAAGEQGQYWEMVDLLFANQPQWGESRVPQTEAFIAYATELGLNIDQFTAGLQNSAYADKAARDQQDTRTLGLRGTPTFFVNGQLVYGLDEPSLRRLIEAGLNG
ncbi:thioredoxin domain-containing protein [Geitlerinema splendidum]|jgi:protein-disulfide isomerase|nr:thioredoxin domain-containing protein [Geitlerinema splendidum]